MDSGNSLLFPCVVPEVAQLSITLLKNSPLPKQVKNPPPLSHITNPNKVNGDTWAKPAGSVPLCCFAIATWTQVSRPSKAAFTAKAFHFLFACFTHGNHFTYLTTFSPICPSCFRMWMHWIYTSHVLVRKAIICNQVHPISNIKKKYHK